MLRRPPAPEAPAATPGADVAETPYAAEAAADAAPLAAGVPAAPAADLTLERVKRAWELILQRVQTSSVSLYAMLRDARPSALEGGTLTVVLPSDFALRRAGEPGNAELLAGAIEAALGQPLSPLFTLPAGDDADPAAPAAPPEQALDFTDLIKHVKGAFDAEELPDDS